MTQPRIRTFNTAAMDPEQRLDNDLCMAVHAGNGVFLRGQTGSDLDARCHGIGDPAAQAEQAMSCVQTPLDGARLTAPSSGAKGNP